MSMRPTEFTTLLSNVGAVVREHEMVMPTVKGFGDARPCSRYMRRTSNGVVFSVDRCRDAEAVLGDVLDAVMIANPGADPAVRVVLASATAHLACPVVEQVRVRRPVWRSRPTHQKVLDEQADSKLQ